MIDHQIYRLDPKMLSKSCAFLFALVLSCLPAVNAQAQNDTGRFNKPPYVDAEPTAARPLPGDTLPGDTLPGDTLPVETLPTEPLQDASAQRGARRDSATAAPDPQVIQLNELARRGELKLADAINSFARIKLWADADRWLVDGVAPINDQNTLADMAQRIGAENLFRLSSHSEISDAGKATVAKLGKALRTRAESKDRILAAIDGLDDPSVDQRLEAARRLLAGGNTALAELVKAAVSQKPTAPQQEILRAMLRIGGRGELAIAQLAIYAKAPIRANALRALTQISRKMAVSDLITSLYATDTTDAEVALARAQLPAIVNTIPTRNEAIGFLYGELVRLRDIAAATENDIQRSPFWTVNADLQSVTPTYSRSVLLAYRDAYDASSRLRRVGGLPATAIDAALAAELSYRVMIDPDWGIPNELKVIRDKFGAAVSAAGISKAISLSLEKNDQPALVGLVRMIDSDLDAGGNELLMASSPNMSPLVRAAMHSQPRVRYEAAMAIVQINPPNSYPGSSHVMRCLAEMQRLEDRPTAILVETRPDVVLRQEGILSRMGLRTKVVGSVGGLEKSVSRGGDIRMILSKTQLWDVPPVELIDRVRRLPYGQEIPVLFYGEDAPGIDTQRWTAFSKLIDRPKSPAAFGNFLIDLDLEQRLPQLTEIDRQQFRLVAKDFLTLRAK